MGKNQLIFRMCGERSSSSSFCYCFPLDFAAYFLGGFQIVLSIFAITTGAFFLNRTHQPESLVLEMSHLKEMTRAQITSDIQLASAWVIGVYSLAGLAAILGIAGTYKKVPWLLNAFAHIF